MRNWLTMIALAMWVNAVYAADAPEAVTKALTDLFGADKLTALEIKPSPVPGLQEVMVEGIIFYISDSGQFLVRGGEILDLKNDGRNLTEVRLGGIRKAELDKLGADGLISFPAKGEEKYVLTIFTDVDCPYCNKAHQEVPALNEGGVTVRYAAFPRAGVGSPTYNKMVSVWCAKDKQQTLTDAKAGKEIASANCENPVAAQYEAGKRMGVTGTPALVLPSGELQPGYMPAARLLRLLEISKKQPS